MSLLPASVPTQGEKKKELRFLAGVRELGLETEDLWLWCDWIRWGQQGQTGWLLSGLSAGPCPVRNQPPAFALCSLIQSWGNHSETGCVCVQVCTSVWGRDGWMERRTQRAIAAPFPSTFHPMQVTPCRGSGLTHRGTFCFFFQTWVIIACPPHKQHHVTSAREAHRWLKGCPACGTVPVRNTEQIWVKTSSKRQMTPEKHSIAVPGQTKPVCGTFTVRLPDGGAAWSTCPYLLLCSEDLLAHPAVPQGLCWLQSFQISSRRKPRILSLLTIFASCTLHCVA